MTLPASLPLDMLQILAEFGAPAGTSLTQLVRGGAYVPNVGQNAGVPTAPPISISNFVGAGANPIVLVNRTINSNALAPANATSTYILTNTGLQQKTINATTTTDHTWLAAGSAADYEVFFGVSSGAVQIGTPNTWQNLGTTRSIGCQEVNDGGGNQSATITVTIRRAVDGIVQGSCTVNLSATVNP